MTNKIGEKIKYLRKKANVTQEKFAEYLGITFQAVSRWESGICYPDLEILPAIANYFNVTTDELLGVDMMNKQERIKEIKEQLREKSSKGLIDDGIAICRAAVNEFPNDYGLLNDLADFLSKRADAKQESIIISERILKDCTNDSIRYNVIYRLALDYNSIGEKAKAIEIGNKLPYTPITRDMLFSDIGTNEEKIHWLIKTITLFSDNMAYRIKNLALAKYTDDKDTEGIQKRIDLYKKAIGIYEIMYEDGDYGLNNTRLDNLYMLISENYLLLNDFNNALDCIDKAVYYAITYDNLLDVEHTSMIFEGVKYSKAQNVLKNNSQNESYRLLNEFLSKEVYNLIREDKRFKSVIAKLEQYAKKET